MTEKIFKINEIDICTESFGNPKNPAILLIMGATCSMVYWDEEFVNSWLTRGNLLFVLITVMWDALSHMNLNF